MTVEIAKLESELRSSGYRMTGPRRVVWVTLSEGGGHLTVDEIARRVHTLDHAVNLSSIYRSLALFAELGLAKESALGGGGSHWELAHPDEQIHLICDDCGQIQHHSGDLVEEVRAHLAEDHDFHSKRVEVLVSGLCARCAARRDLDRD